MGNEKGHFDHVKRSSSICKICQSPHRAEIEHRIENKMVYSKISAWLLKQKPPEKISTRTISRHTSKHNFKIIMMDPDKKKDKNKSGASDAQIKTLTEFLDLVIEKVEKGVVDNKLVPTVTEGIKAAEIKAKIKEGSKWEHELVKFFMEVSQNHGYSN